MGTMDRSHEYSLTERYRELSDDIAAAVAVAPDLEDVYFQRLRLQARARAAA